MRIKDLLIKKTNSLSMQFIRYIFVGGIAFIADYATLWCFTEYLHFHYLISASIAFIAGLAVNYILSTIWVFSKPVFSNKIVEFVLFGLIGVIGLVLNGIIMYLLTDKCGVHYMASKLVSTVTVFIWNFAARRFLLYKK
ncbi:MAG: GtrA family protein [Bacteroidetes bacterium]|uniref:GtrA family protein n=1 Tax=Candidatus Caccoplasma merdipullorum TaxID=2840718 RepID=A0A9D9E3S6_9BACT|nr:GtrA family protein [Candidatus Caccoplasma merdipullorum]